jgi:uncharacterized protein (DUF433 family)
MNEQDTIINRGRGPEIRGTRITVYDILDYTSMGWHHTAIAATLRLSSQQVLEAIRYIEDHKPAVLAEYEKMLERDARGNPPELQARLDETHAKYQALWAEMRRQGLMPEDNGDEGHPGGQ